MGDATLFGPEREQRGGRFARVVVERGIDRPLTDAFEGLTYRLADEPVGVGDRVEVPLGRGDTPTGGFVVEIGGPELLAGTPESRVKPVLRRSGGRLTPRLIELARWMAGYYIAPMGMVLGTMLPAAVKHATGRRTELRIEPALPASEHALDALRPGARRAWDALVQIETSRFPMTPRDAADTVGAKTLAPINQLLRAGLLRAVQVEMVRTLGEAVGGLSEAASGATGEEDIRPTLKQTATIDEVGATLGTFRPHLIHGVTGSGKTEVYLRLIARVLAAGKSAIVLVPEISLTPQTASRFERRFALAGGVAVLHSGLSPSQRHAQWARAAEGRARVVVGARSAIFAPVPDLGLIVVDEEHDASYKQDQVPRYHARDVAVVRASIEKCPVVLGSATPSLESWSNAKSGKYSLWPLLERVGGAELPAVKVVDLAAERRARYRRDPADAARVHLLGPTLESAIESTLTAGGQAILLLNRRGFANYICCPAPACGWVLTCDLCSTTMVYHRGKSLPRGGMIVCHHCQTQRVLPTACPECARALNVYGLGTQRVEEELCRKFGSAFGIAEGSTLLRLDSDTMKSARDYFDALERFGRGEARMLIGTQMVAKGLDFPNVRLVGIVMADTALNLPDFRAAERTFQLVSQVSGRAGRAEHKGLVVVQTFSPEHPAITFAASHDFEGFATLELGFRARAGLPPSTRMARIVCRDKAYEKAWRSAGELAGALRGAGVETAGPMDCVIARIAGYHRVSVEARAPDAGSLNRALNSLRHAGLLRSDARTAVDVDPVHLM